jgi:hypothetical protein
LASHHRLRTWKCRSRGPRSHECTDPTTPRPESKSRGLSTAAYRPSRTDRLATRRHRRLRHLC